MLFRFLLNIFTIYILVNSISSCKGGNRHTEMKVKFRKGGESCSKGNNSSCTILPEHIKVIENDQKSNNFILKPNIEEIYGFEIDNIEGSSHFEYNFKLNSNIKYTFDFSKFTTENKIVSVRIEKTSSGNRDITWLIDERSESLLLEDFIFKPIKKDNGEIKINLINKNSDIKIIIDNLKPVDYEVYPNFSEILNFTDKSLFDRVLDLYKKSMMFDNKFFFRNERICNLKNLDFTDNDKINLNLNEVIDKYCGKSKDNLSNLNDPLSNFEEKDTQKEKICKEKKGVLKKYIVDEKTVLICEPDGNDLNRLKKEQKKREKNLLDYDPIEYEKCKEQNDVLYCKADILLKNKEKIKKRYNIFYRKCFVDEYKLKNGEHIIASFDDRELTNFFYNYNTGLIKINKKDYQGLPNQEPKQYFNLKNEECQY